MAPVLLAVDGKQSRAPFENGASSGGRVGRWRELSGQCGSMKAVVVEHDLLGQLATSNEYDPWTIGISGKDPPTAASHESNWRSVALEELGHPAKGVACDAKLGQSRI